MSRIMLGAVFVAITLAGMAAASPLDDSVTMQARATVLRTGESDVGVFGTISNGAEGEYVAVTGKECGIPGSSFRALGGATTTAGGNWETSASILTTTTLRAEWKNAVSTTVVVRPRAWVMLSKLRGSFTLRVGLATGRIAGKRVTIQRLTPADWKRLQTVVMTSAVESGLRFRVPKGTSIRAVLPLAQAKPCYLAGYSNIVQT